MNYNVFLGRFTTQEDCKKVQKELNKSGHAAKIYSLGECFSLLICGTTDYSIAYAYWKIFTDKGYKVEILNM